MDDYLKTAVEKLKNRNYGKLNIVLGNESCDLDSAVSAIVYATYLNWQYQQLKCGRKPEPSSLTSGVVKDEIFIPILNVNKEEYQLKTEVVFCLREHAIFDDKLVFRDEYDWPILIKETPTNVILVDHHILAGRDYFLQPHVTEIIDHRPVNRKLWNYQEDIRVCIDKVGSCCTLIAQNIKELNFANVKEVNFFKQFDVYTELLHCTIILDTVNFSPEVKKGTQNDKEIVEYLERILEPNDIMEERKCKLERLQEAKCDVSKLNAAQLLRKDLKILKTFLVPSFPILVEDFLRKDNVSEALVNTLIAKNCKTAVLVGMRTRPELQRDLGVYSLRGVADTMQFSKFLLQWPNPPLNLEAQKAKPPYELLHYKQHNLTCTRKQYIELISDYIQIYKEEFQDL